VYNGVSILLFATTTIALKKKPSKYRAKEKEEKGKKRDEG
jgi:hypothetical protein